MDWSTLAYLSIPWAEVAPFPWRHPLTVFQYQQRNGTWCQQTSSVEAWGDKEPTHHWAAGGGQLQCLSQGFWGDDLPMQSCDFPLVLFGCDIGHQQGAGKTGQQLQPPNTCHPLFERLKEHCNTCLYWDSSWKELCLSTVVIQTHYGYLGILAESGLM